LIKKFQSEDYNMAFNTKNGNMIRFGKTLKCDPKFCRVGPELLDIEISAGGDCLGGCEFCYKCNGGNGPTHNMSLDTFKSILDKFNKEVLCQIALGIMNISTNPEFFDMMRYAREVGIVPNYTTHGLDMCPQFAKFSAELCGCVSVSMVDPKATYSAVHMLTEAGVKQVNIHYMLSEETFDGALRLLEEASRNDKLSALHAVVFLQYKSKGRGIGKYTTIQSVDKYRLLMEAAGRANIGIGMDSCSAPMYMKTILEGKENAETLLQHVEPCESGLFSSYINCHGKFFPCSFLEGEGEWADGLDVLACKSFDAIWNHPKVVAWRNLLITPPDCKCSLASTCRVCPVYKELKCG